MSVSSNYFSATARTTRTCFWQVNPRHDKCTYRNIATAISHEINHCGNKQMEHKIEQDVTHVHERKSIFIPCDPVARGTNRYRRSLRFPAVHNKEAPKRASEVEANARRFKYEVVRDPGALEESSKWRRMITLMTRPRGGRRGRGWRMGIGTP